METYPAGSLVMHEGELREFTVDHPTGPWISGDNRAASIASVVKYLVASKVIAVDYEDLTFPIAEGTQCFHDGGYFYANTDIATSEDWTAAHWTETSVAEQLGNMKKELPKLTILEYADDWKTITNDFSLVDGSLVYTDNGVQGTLADLNIKFSKKLKLIYFDCPKAWLISTTSLDNNWRRFLVYNGNEFETALNGGTNPNPSSFVLPSDVNRGMVFANCVTHNGTTRDFGMLGYVGSTSSNSGIAVKKISSYENPTGVVIDKCVFAVVPK